MQEKHKLFFLQLVILLIIAVILSMHLGPKGISFLANRDIFYFRLSRILLAIIAGSSLSISGASLQALFRNNLADPHIFGISGGAAVGACLVIAFGASWGILPNVGAMLGGCFAFILIFYFVKFSQNNSNALLVGVLINSLAASIITILKTILSAEKTQNLLFWLIGNFSIVEMKDFYFIVPIWLIGIFLLLSIKNNLDILAFGEDEATLLGVDTKKMLHLGIIANCLLIGNVVCFAGMIGFIGLIIPHLVRKLFNTNYSNLLPFTLVAGAFVLVLFESLSRLSFKYFSTEIPVGAICALFLSPLFFLILGKNTSYD